MAVYFKSICNERILSIGMLSCFSEKSDYMIMTDVKIQVPVEMASCVAANDIQSQNGCVMPWCYTPI